MSKRPNRKTDMAPGVADPSRGPARPAAPPTIDQRPAEPVDPAHREAVEEGMAEAKDGAFAADEAIEALYRQAGL